jgi:hypothetical protein
MKSLTITGRVYCQGIGFGAVPSAGRCNHLAEFDSFCKADGPKIIARHTVRLDRIAAVEQSHQICDGECVLRLFALAGRASRYEENGSIHGASFLDARQPSLSGNYWFTRRLLPTSPFAVTLH